MHSSEGASLLRHNIVCSILSKKPLHITNINSDKDPIGIQMYEANFLKFIDRVTSGSSFQTQDHNTSLVFTPGMILGGVFSHEVPSPRCVTYLLEVAVLLLPFAKFDSRITFVGATQGALDLSVDTFRTVTTRWLQLFGLQCGIRTISRGATPGGGGAVILEVKALRKISYAVSESRGRVRRIRGIAFGCRTAPDLPQRSATTAKGFLLNLIPDVYIVTDVDAGGSRRNESSSGYGVMLVAETTADRCLLSQETVAHAGEAPEEVGRRAAELLCDQIYEGGCVDGHHQMMVLLLMAVASSDAPSSMRFGKLTPGAVSIMVLIQSYFGVTFGQREEESFAGSKFPPTNLITCFGSDLVNVWKRSS
ncbi:unnamed protein product [Phytomonas sp. Hart1]|nr:unnamed protein product [Phytomonas sp. Hart1]|eukprot:CCW69392.1 unnamed protein product [Phytomonas sp. isolate Hart1]